MNNTKHIHFIGICGVAMSALAIALHKTGYTVTGSDKGFYPPVSTHLKNAGITYYPGWHVEKMTKHGDPDLVIVGNVASSTNPEFLYVQENNIAYKSYPEFVAEFLVKEHSIVCAGNFGKTSTSALLSWILKENEYKPSYMFGGLATHNFPSAEITDGAYSVLEGDEYKTARWDTRPKFMLYSPTHLLLTSISWDHADLYPTEALYMKQFEHLVSLVPKNGLIVACKDGKNVTEYAKQSQSRVVFYGKDEENEYSYTNITSTKNGLHFDIIHNSSTYSITSPLLGTYMVENICGAFAMASELGIQPQNITQSVRTFLGMRRRLEKRCENNITVFDDIAHSPEKAASTLATLRSIYTGKIIAIYEPNTGNRNKEAVPQYAHAFAHADSVIIPRLSAVKQGPNTPEIMDGKALSDMIETTHPNTKYIEDDNELVTHLIEHTKKEDVIVFLGSHGFRGMIEMVCKAIT